MSDVLHKSIKAGKPSYLMASSHCFELVRFHKKHTNVLEDRPNGQDGDSEMKNILKHLEAKL